METGGLVWTSFQDPARSFCQTDLSHRRLPVVRSVWEQILTALYQSGIVCGAANRTDFVLTTSLDGHLKLWKKQAEGIEFVKHYRAHLKVVTAVSASADGAMFATVGEDGAKVFDVVNFGTSPTPPFMSCEQAQQARGSH